jgi:hypothetical protein
MPVGDSEDLERGITRIVYGPLMLKLQITPDTLAFFYLHKSI